jgi:microcystin-dependent protein
MWSGSSTNIPAGWALCNGTNSTPNLSGRFIVGVGSNNTNTYSINDKGGQDSVTLTTNQIPSHAHRQTFTANPGNGGPANFVTMKEPGNGSLSYDLGVDTYSTGGGQQHENRPSYYALCYIIKV